MFKKYAVKSSEDTSTSNKFLLISQLQMQEIEITESCQIPHKYVV